MKYYQVKAKCGHVGRNNYIVKNLYVRADNAKEAARIARNIPRVKHHHKDAIREVTEITFEGYQEGLNQHEFDPYFIVDNRQDQELWCNLSDEIMKEDVCNKPKKNRNKQHIISTFLVKEWNCRRSYFYE